MPMNSGSPEAEAYASRLSSLFASPSPKVARCLASHPWVQPTVARRFAWFHKWTQELLRDGTISSNRTVDILQAMFSNRSQTGFKGLATVQYNGTTPHAQLWWHRGSHSMEAFAATLLSAMASYADELEPLLGGRPLHLFWTLYDGPVIRQWRERMNGYRLPFFSMSEHGLNETGSGWAEIAVPDFTFQGYQKLRSARTRWYDVLGMLLRGAGSVPWERRERKLTWRGRVRGSQAREALVPYFQAARANATRVPLDVKPTEGRVGRPNFLNLSAQCQSKYLLHLDGNGYSAGLKYKLACGSLVIKADSALDEFYYPGLRAGVHYLRLKPEHRGKLRWAFEARMLPRLNQLFNDTESAEGSARASRIAAAGQRFAAEQLTEPGISCYWYVVLRHYALLLSADSTDNSLASVPLRGVQYRLRTKYEGGKSSIVR